MAKRCPGIFLINFMHEVARQILQRKTESRLFFRIDKVIYDDSLAVLTAYTNSKVKSGVMRLVSSTPGPFSINGRRGDCY